MQFNFPDHTKLVLSSAGTYLDFYHLLPQDATYMTNFSRLPTNALESRSCLSLPTATMKLWADPSYHPSPASSLAKTVLVSNSFNEKLAFVEEVVSAWIENGGLGEFGPGGNVRANGKLWAWEGTREVLVSKDGSGTKGEKLVWVSVGCPGGADGDYKVLNRVIDC